MACPARRGSGSAGPHGLSKQPLSSTLSICREGVCCRPRPGTFLGYALRGGEGCPRADSPVAVVTGPGAVAPLCSTRGCASVTLGRAGAVLAPGPRPATAGPPPAGTARACRRRRSAGPSPAPRSVNLHPQRCRRQRSGATPCSSCPGSFAAGHWRPPWGGRERPPGLERRASGTSEAPVARRRPCAGLTPPPRAPRPPCAAIGPLPCARPPGIRNHGRPSPMPAR
jgi:hypothetical protein